MAFIAARMSVLRGAHPSTPWGPAAPAAPPTPHPSDHSDSRRPPADKSDGVPPSTLLFAITKHANNGQTRHAAIAARRRFRDGAQRAGTSFWKRLIVIVLLRKPAYENITRTPLPRRYGWLAAPVDCGSGFGLGGGHWGVP